MGVDLKLISAEYFEAYSKTLDIDWVSIFDRLKEKTQFTVGDFEYYIISSALFSSKIEGNPLDVNSFFGSRGKKSSPRKKEVTEIETLMDAYQFASENRLNRTHFLQSHALLSKTLLPAKERGRLRTDQVGVRDTETLRPVYLAVEPEFLKEEFSKLFDDIEQLMLAELSREEIFYYASMIHLWLALIHPFVDGNGRSARLLEKWFLVAKLGDSAWSVLSEKYYWDHRPEYYQHIAIGFNYYSLHWERCLPFLYMLPQALKV